MKKLFLLVLLLLMLAAPALATDVTIAANQMPDFNASSLGSDVTITGVTATNGSTILISSGKWRPNWMGIGGFRITIDFVDYTVAYVTDSNFLMLTTPYQGTTTSVATVVWHRYAELRFYVTSPFRPLGKDIIIQSGTPGSGAWYKRVAASVITVAGVNTLFIPELTLDATTDSPTDNTAQYQAAFYTPGGAEIQRFDCFRQFGLPPVTPTNWADICTFNSSPINARNVNAYTQDQSDAMHPSCAQGQMTYYKATGRAQQCLNVGANLSITDGVLNATGSGGGGIGGSIAAGQAAFGVFANNIGGSPNYLYDSANVALTLKFAGTGGYRVFLTDGSSGDNRGYYQSSSVSLIRFSTTAADPPTFAFLRGRQGGAFPQSGYTLGEFDFYGTNDSTGVLGATISAVTTQVHSASSGGTKLLFSTTPNSTTTPLVRLTIDQDGKTITAGLLQTTATATTPAFNLGGVTVDPSGAINGSMWYRSDLDKFRCREGGSNVNCIGNAVNVRNALNAVGDYGAPINGSSDATTAIQTCVSASSAAKPCYLPGNANQYVITALTMGDNQVLIGDGGKSGATRLKTVTNSPVISVPTTAFNAQIQGVKIVGNSTGSNQIGVQLGGTGDYWGVYLHDVMVDSTGGFGFQIIRPFSSHFDELYWNNTVGYGLEYEGNNEPINTFTNLYAQGLTSTAPTGYRIKSGYFHCDGCNGINSTPTGAKWVVIGKKNGVDGDVSDGSAFFDCHNCNMESWSVNAVLAYAGSSFKLRGATLIAGAGNPAAKPIMFDLAGNGTVFFAERSTRSVIEDSVIFGDGPLSNYANGQAIHANGFAPLQVDGIGAFVASDNRLSTYYDDVAGKVNKLARADNKMPCMQVSATTSVTSPGVRCFEVDSTGGPVTLTINWSGWNFPGQEEEVWVRDKGGAASTNNITISANSGGSVGGSSFIINQNNGSVRLWSDPAATDWRVVGQYPGARIPYIASGGSPNLNFFPTWSATDGKLSLSSGIFNLSGDTVFTGGILANIDGTKDIGLIGGNRFRSAFFTTTVNSPKYVLGANLFWTSNSGTPNSVVTADIGSIVSDTTGKLWFKQSGGGNTGWIDITAGGGGGTPGGASTNVQYNDSGSFGGENDFTYDKTNNLLAVKNAPSGGVFVYTVTGASGDTRSTITPSLDSFYSFSNTATADGAIAFLRGRAGPAYPNSGDALGELVFYGTNDTTASLGAYFRAYATQTHTSSAAGTKFELATSTDGSVSPTARMTWDQKGNVVMGTAALPTNATDGFFYAPSSAGPPTGTATTYTGRVAIDIDTTNSRIYGNIGGSWVNLSGTGGGGLSDPGGNGIVVRTALNTTINRTISLSSNLSGSNLDGVSGNPSIDTVQGIQITSTPQFASLGLGTTAPTAGINITGKTLSTDANLSVAVENETFSLTKNNANTRTFYGTLLKATFNPGGSNTNTTVIMRAVDTVNTSLTGTTVVLDQWNFGGAEVGRMSSSGQLTTILLATGGAQILQTVATPPPSVGSLSKLAVFGIDNVSTYWNFGITNGTAPSNWGVQNDNSGNLLIQNYTTGGTGQNFLTFSASGGMTLSSNGGSSNIYSISSDGSHTMVRMSAPSNPASGFLKVYADNSTGKLACLDSSGANCMPSGGGGGSPGGSTGDFQINSGGSFAAGGITQGSNGRFVFSPTATGGTNVVGYTFNGSNDSNITTTANAIYMNFLPVGTLQHAAGTVALQTDIVVNGLTHTAVGSSTYTEVATMNIISPLASTNVTFTAAEVLRLVPQADAHKGIVVVEANNSATGAFLEGFSGGTSRLKLLPFVIGGSRVGAWIDMSTTGPSGIGSGGAGSNLWIGYSDGTGTYLSDAATGDIIYRGANGKSLRFGIDNGSGTAASTMTLSAAQIGINKGSSNTAVLYAVNPSNAIDGIVIETGAGAQSTHDMLISTQLTTNTNAVQNVGTFTTNSSGTAATGFGGSFTFNLEDSTTNAQKAAGMTWAWSDGTHATREGFVAFNTTHSGTDAERMRINFFGIQLAPVTFSNLGTPGNGTVTFCSDCTVAATCAGSGTGAIAKRLNSVWVCN